MISKMYWKFLQSFFRSALEKSYKFYAIEITWYKIAN